MSNSLNEDLGFVIALNMLTGVDATKLLQIHHLRISRKCLCPMPNN
jgi:hypothetical protein